MNTDNKGIKTVIKNVIVCYKNGIINGMIKIN